MKKILIVRTSAIGDIVHTFESAEYLRSRFPDAQIDWVVEKGSSDLLKAHPHLDRIICIDTKKWKKSLSLKDLYRFYKELTQTKYDVLFDFQGNIKSAVITFLAKAKDKVGFSWKTVREKPNVLATNKKFHVPNTLNIRKRYIQLIESYFTDPFIQLPRKALLRLNADEQARLESVVTPYPTIMVSCGSKWKNKRIDETVLKEFLLKIDQTLSPHFIFIWSGDAEKELANSYGALFKNSQTLGNLTLPLWQAVMNKVICVIAVDSAALHLCGTTQTPSFSVFGPTKASVFKPSSDTHVAFQGICPYSRSFEKQCPILRSCKTGACINNINAEQLYDAFLIFWEKMKDEI